MPILNFNLPALSFFGRSGAQYSESRKSCGSTTQLIKATNLWYIIFKLFSLFSWLFSFRIWRKMVEMERQRVQREQMVKNQKWSTYNSDAPGGILPHRQCCKESRWCRTKSEAPTTVTHRGRGVSSPRGSVAKPELVRLQLRWNKNKFSSLVPTLIKGKLNDR